MKPTGKTVKLTGPGLNCWFAEQIVKDQGAEKALENTSGPMHEAVKAVIAASAAKQADSASGRAQRTNNNKED